MGKSSGISTMVSMSLSGWLSLRAQVGLAGFQFLDDLVAIRNVIAQQTA
jgi:hypothetical protein